MVGVRVGLGGEALGPLRAQSSGYGGHGGRRVLKAWHVRVFVSARLELPLADDVGPRIGSSAAQPDIDAGAAGTVRREVPAGFVRLALSGVGGEGIAVGQSSDDAGPKALGQV